MSKKKMLEYVEAIRIEAANNNLYMYENEIGNLKYWIKDGNYCYAMHALGAVETLAGVDISTDSTSPLFELLAKELKK